MTDMKYYVIVASNKNAQKVQCSSHTGEQYGIFRKKDIIPVLVPPQEHRKVQERIGTQFIYEYKSQHGPLQYSYP